jgi:hypothetical protein
MAILGRARPLPVHLRHGLASTLYLAVAQTAEVDLAQAINKQKQVSVGQVAETDSVTQMVIGPFFARLQVETDEAGMVTLRRSYAILQASETDSVTTSTVQKLLTISQPSSASTAQAITPAKTHTIGQVEETDSAFAFNFSIFVVGRVTSLNEAFPITVIGGRNRTLITTLTLDADSGDTLALTSETGTSLALTPEPGDDLELTPFI